MRFKNKVVLVTGATENTGVDIAAYFIKQGANVCINGSTNEQLEIGSASLRDMGLVDFHQIQADISDTEEVKAMFEIIEQTYGGLDILVNNAADQGLDMTFETMKPEDFLQVIMVNLFGTFQVSQYAVKLMVKQSKGVIVNLGSNVSTRAIHDRTAYITSKGGIDALTRSMAVDLAAKGIRVNMVAPGYIHTERWKTLTENHAQRRRKNIPLQREASMEDIALAVAFLASEDASSITGERLVVDGGSTAQHLPIDIDI